MKKTLSIAVLLLVTIMGCKKYNDSELIFDFFENAEYGEIRIAFA